jgi:hypothetical protein
MAKNIQVLLNSITVAENGEEGVAAAATLVSISLTYPNTQSTSLSTVKGLKLKDSTKIDFVTGVNPDTNKPYTYSDRIVFKASLVGKTSLNVGVATVHKTSKLEALLVSIFGAVFGAAWKLLVGGITNVLVGAAVETVGAAHVKSFEAADEHSNPIGDGFLEFEEGQLPPSPITIQLIVPDDLTVERFEFPQGGGQPQKVKKKILSKGANNGTIELELKEI